MTNSAVQPGGIQIEKCLLKSLHSGKEIDITNILVEFNIYENIRQPFMSASFLILDSLALTTTFPIIGNETVEIKFFVPVEGLDNSPIQKKFRVLSIEKLEVGEKQRFASYIIKTALPEYFKDLTKLVKKSYSDMIVSDMVKDVFVNYLEGNEKDLTLSKSTGMPTLVVPAMRPSETINKLFCRYAKDSFYQSVSNFMFYSSIDGYHFKTIEEMIDPDKISYRPDKYFWTEKNLSKTDNDNAIKQSNRSKPPEWLKISSFTILNKLNVEDSIKKGMYDSNVFYINPNNSTYGKKTFEYNYDFDKFKRTSSANSAYKTILEESDLANRKGESLEYFIPTNINEPAISTSNEDPRYLFLGLQNASLAMMDNVSLLITTPGDNTRKIGDVVDIQLPEFGATDDVIGELDTYLSGFYLVSAIRHLYNVKNGYYTIMLCNKNCFEKMLDNNKVG